MVLQPPFLCVKGNSFNRVRFLPAGSEKLIFYLAERCRLDGGGVMQTSAQPFSPGITVSVNGVYS